MESLHPGTLNSPTLPSASAPSDPFDLDYIDSQWPGVDPEMKIETIRVAPLPALPVMVVGPSFSGDDQLELLALMLELSDDTANLDPDFADLAKAVRGEFTAFVDRLDAGAKVAWQPIEGGFDLFVFGMSENDLDAVHALISTDTLLLVGNGIEAASVTIAGKAIHVFVPYNGRTHIDLPFETR